MSIDVRTEVPGTYKQVITIDAHTLRADMPVVSGGEGSAPGAHEYFDASLGICKAMTTTFYAKRNNYPLERVEVHVERDDTQERQGTYLLKVNLVFFGEGLSAEQKATLHELSTKCPVHKLMTTTKVQIETRPLE